MAFGTVKWFNPEKRYGFIDQERGESVFVHQSALEPPLTTLNAGDRVTFEFDQGPKGLAARNVRLDS